MVKTKVRPRFALIGPLTIAFVLFLNISALSGQSTVQNLTGTVTDRRHEPLKGAIVEVHNELTDGVVSYITRRDGLYSFTRLDGGADYRVWATYRGQQSRKKKLSHFDSKPSRAVNLIVKLH